MGRQALSGRNWGAFDVRTIACVRSAISWQSAPITTRQATDHHPASDLVRRNFMAERPNELWVAEITFLPTLAGFLYLAVVLDAWSRRIVGWAFSADLKTRVVLDALDMALMARKPDNVVHHSDSQRIAASFRAV